jgi:uncharacterized damage-inducible protein DinB
MKISEIATVHNIAYYSEYLADFEAVELNEILEISLYDFIHFVREIPLGKHDYSYAENKWTIKEIIQHIIDAERIFSYRALRIGRSDVTPLPSFDENSFAAVTDANARTLQALLEELSAVRQSTLLLFKSFTKEDLLRKGIVAGNEQICGALGFVIVGHMKHHQKVYKEKYLV